MLDWGYGRIALQSLATGGFVTVKGIGGMAQEELKKKMPEKMPSFRGRVCRKAT